MGDNNTTSDIKPTINSTPTTSTTSPTIMPPAPTITQPPNSEPMLATSSIFCRHTDSVLCCAIDSRSRIAVSGGIDDTAFVWDVNTKHVIFECLGHKESVVAASFSLNSSYVATGDLNGYIQVRNTTTGIRIFEFDIDEINWIQWHNSSEYVLLAGTTKGDFWMWNVNDPAAVKTFPSYGFPTTAAKLLPDGIKIISAYGDGSVRLFDLKTGQPIFQLTNLGGTKSEIISMDLNPSNSLLAVGCIDSTIKLINTISRTVVGTLVCKSPEVQPVSTSGSTSGTTIQNNDMIDDNSQDQLCSSSPSGKIDGQVEDALEAMVNADQSIEVIDEYSATNQLDKNGGGQNEDGADGEYSDESSDFDMTEAIQSVESVLFSPCGNYLAGANNSGTIIIWDVSSQVTRCELHTGIGITRCAWSTDGKYITGCLDGVVRFYDLNLNKLREEGVHSDQILDLALRDNLLVTASEDKTCTTIRISE